MAHKIEKRTAIPAEQDVWLSLEKKLFLTVTAESLWFQLPKKSAPQLEARTCIIVIYRLLFNNSRE